MSIFQLSPKSEERLKGVHPDLERVVRKAIAITPLDFMVIEGLRDLKRQEQLVAAGASKTIHSRHLSGHAVDLCPLYLGQLAWDRWALFDQLSQYVKKAAMMENVKIEWGGDWKPFKDGPHYQLPWKEYPLG